MVLFGQKWLTSGIMVLLGQKWLYSGKNGSSCAEVVVFGQKWLYFGKVVVFRQSGCIRTKVVVFG